MERMLANGRCAATACSRWMSTGHCAGWAGVLHPLEWPEPELAYSLDQPFWGRGIATEAVRAARDWAFARLGVVRLASFIMPDNVRSARVAEKLGAVRDGTTTIRGFQVEWWVHRRAQETTRGIPLETLEMG